MFEKTQVRGPKVRVMVQLCLATGRIVEGDVFAICANRVSDLFNDERAFLPVDVGDGQIEMVAKAHIASVQVKGEVPTLEDDPYRILRIERTASDAEVRGAWMKGMKKSHPDRFAALDLDPYILAAARTVCQRLNNAYDQILRDRKAERAA